MGLYDNLHSICKKVALGYTHLNILNDHGSALYNTIKLKPPKVSWITSWINKLKTVIS